MIIERVLCTAGHDFYVIGIHGDYTRCYHNYLTKEFFLGNILQENEFKQLRGDEMECVFNISCLNDSVCRGTCDAAKTLRFNFYSKKRTLLETSNQYEFGYETQSAANVRNDCAMFFWHITEQCNYRCIYCPFPLSDEQYDPDNLISTFDKMVNQFSGKIRIVFTGGEPCIHPRFFDLIKHINDYTNATKREIYFIIISNLSTHKKWMEILEYNWNSPFGVVASCHICEDKMDLYNFVEICKKIKQVNTNNYLEINFVDHPHEQKYIEFYKLFFEKNNLDADAFITYAYDASRARTTDINKFFVPKSFKNLIEYISENK